MRLLYSTHSRTIFSYISGEFTHIDAASVFIAWSSMGFANIFYNKTSVRNITHRKRQDGRSNLEYTSNFIHCKGGKICWTDWTMGWREPIIAWIANINLQLQIYSRTSLLGLNHHCGVNISSPSPGFVQAPRQLWSLNSTVHSCLWNQYRVCRWSYLY